MGFCKIHLHLKLSVTNFEGVLTVKLALGIIYSRLCVLAQSHDMI
jgi:hypothetical protein